MNHKGTVLLKTERLILRQLTLEDAPAAFRNWTGDAKVTRFLTWPTHESEEVTKSLFQNWAARYSDPEFYQWAIVPVESGEPIGTISAVEIDEKTEKVQLGYCIGSHWWRMGYTTEALRAVLAFFFEQVRAHRMEALHDSENPNSGKVMAKCGMIYKGTLRSAARNNRGIVDVCVYGLLAEDYFASNPT